jgi:hypothetical protein
MASAKFTYHSPNPFPTYTSGDVIGFALFVDPLYFGIGTGALWVQTAYG